MIADDDLITSVLLVNVLQAIDEAIFVVDESGTISIVNQKGRDLIGVQEAVGQPFAKLVPALKALIERPLVHQARHNINGKDYNVKVVEIAPTQTSHYIIITLKDSYSSTDWQDGESDLSNILEGFADGIYITDSDGNTLFMNSACSQITGLQKEVVIGKNVNELVKQGIIFDSSTLAVLKSGRAETILQRTLSGKTVLVSAKFVKDQSGNVRLIVSTTRDITDLNHAKSQLEKERLLSNHYLSELMAMKLADLHTKMAIHSEKMMKIVELATHVAKTDSTILMTGESGAGKDVLCRFIHSQSPRAEQAFIKINCAAIPDALLESELFGYESGAFTGAKKRGKPGLIELADKGTVFFDEIGELPFSLQAKLLQVLQEKSFNRVGGTSPKKVDIRIVAATNKDLRELVGQGKFRKDLFYRLNVVPITIPPLRDRRDEIPHMVYYFLSRLNQKYGLNKVLSKELIDVLQEHDWPGNVRELENCIEQLVVVNKDEVLTPEHLPMHVRIGAEQQAMVIADIMPLRAAIEEFERQLVEKAYKKTGSTYKAAKLLAVSQATVVRKLNKRKIVPMQ